MKKRKFAEGGEAESRFDDDTYARARKFVEGNERRAGEGMANDEAETPVSVRRAEPSVAPKPKPVPKPTPKPVLRADENYSNEGRNRPPKMSDVPDTRGRIAARFGSEEQRSKNTKDQMIPQADIDAAKAAGAAKRAQIAKQDEDFSKSRNNLFKRFFGTQAMREEARGYAKGGSIDGCAQRGKTKGRMY